MLRYLVLILLILSPFVSMIPNTLAAECTDCHGSYNVTVNSTHNQTRNASAPSCTGCHTGYDAIDNHTTGTKGYTVNESNTCRSCHADNVRGFYERHSGSSDCTQCHFANTTQRFSLNTSLFTHDHNLTIEHNFYNYNLSGGIPLISNSGTGLGMFPYYSCQILCHGTGYGNLTSGTDLNLEEAASSWIESAHARSRHGNETYDSKNSCARCKSPPNYNTSASSSAAIAEADWQGIQCRVCHNLHNRSFSGISGFPVAFYNSTSSSQAGYPVYEAVANATVLCENCHSGNNGRSYDGYHKQTLNFTCKSCHGNSTFNNEEHLFEVKNTTSGVTGCEVCHTTASHTWSFTSLHTANVTCEACHDQKFTVNATNFSVTGTGTANYNNGLYKNSTTNKWTIYKVSSGVPTTWALHNISRSVNCTKCHNAYSPWNGTTRQDTLIAPSFSACIQCHSSYGSAVNSTRHNQTINASAPDCTDCHTGYQPINNHTTGTKGYTVNESNTCRSCHVDNVNGFYERHTSSSDCTQCHFANTTRPFSLNASLFTHDHNLTIEHNFYNYNLSGGIPLISNSGTGLGMFPYYSCQIICHGTGYGNVTSRTDLNLEEAASSWNESAHARSRRGNETSDSNAYCAKCKSPTQYNASASSGNRSSYPITESEWKGIQCRICHNLHDRKHPNNTGPSGFPVAFYNSTSSYSAGYAVYDAVSNDTVLCEKCHSGNNGRSYEGYHRQTLNFTCKSCHGNSTFNNESHLFEVKNTTSGITGCEVCHEAADHTWSLTSPHINNVTCEACHDQKFVVNATNFSVTGTGTANYNNGLYKNSTTNKWTIYKVSSGVPTTWALHNISRSVNCTKCHNAYSPWNGTTRQDTLIAPSFSACIQCHSSYGSAVNSTRHNQTVNASAPNCTYCHTGYQPNYGHTSGTKGYIVNETNTCRNCHVQNVSGFYERHSSSSDCTQCHFSNTTRTFGLNASLFTHDHNLTVEHSFYEYNLSGGMPLIGNSGTGLGMFPYYSCQIPCHGSSGTLTSTTDLNLEIAASSWNESAHARSRRGNETSDSNAYCAKCKSPTQYNASASSGNRSSYPITESEWKGIQCRICHNLHDRKHPNNTGPSGFPVAFYNSTASYSAGYAVYDAVSNDTVLCENCHSGNNGRSYDGYHKQTLNFTCKSCHGNSTFNNEEHLFEVKNTTSSVTGCSVCHTTASHTWSFTSLHTAKVTCEACHDQKFVVNATNFAVTGTGTANYNNGLYKNTTTNKWTIYKVSSGVPTTWALHNISRSVNCTKCHNAYSPWNGTIRQDTLIAGNITSIVSCIGCHDTGGISTKQVNFSALNASNSVHRTLNYNSSTAVSTSNSRCWGCHGDGDGSESAQPVNDHPSNYNTPKNCNNNDCHSVSRSGYNETMVYSHFKNASRNDNPGNITSYNVTTVEPCENCHVNSLVTEGTNPNLALASHYASKNKLIDSFNCTYCHTDEDNSEKWGNATLISKNRTSLVEFERVRNKLTASEGETVYLGEGYYLKVLEISIGRENAYLQLLYNGSVVDEILLGANTQYEYKKKVIINRSSTVETPVITLSISSVFKGEKNGFIQFSGFRIKKNHTERESKNPACYACHLYRNPEEKERYQIIDKEYKTDADDIYYTKVLTDFKPENKSKIYFNDEDYMFDQLENRPGEFFNIVSRQKLLAEGETWNISDNYSLKLNEVSTDSNLSWLTLSIDGSVVKDDIAGIGSEFKYSPGIKYKDTVGTNVTIFTANITAVFQGRPNFILLKDVVALSPQVLKVTSNDTLFGYNSSWFNINDTLTVGRIPTNLHTPNLRDDTGNWADCAMCHDASKKLRIPGIENISTGLGKHSILNIAASNKASLSDSIDKACWACHTEGAEPQTHSPTHIAPRYCTSCHIDRKEPFYGATDINNGTHRFKSDCEVCHIRGSHNLVKPAGLSVISEVTLPQSVKKGETVNLTAKANAGYGMKVRSAEYFIDTKDTSGKGKLLKAVDGAFDSQIEQIVAEINTADIPAGEHIIYIHAMGTDNKWGEFYSANFSIISREGSGSKAIESARSFLKSIPGLDMIFVLLSLVAVYFIILGIRRR